MAAIKKPKKPKAIKKPKASASNEVLKNYLRRRTEKEVAYKKALAKYEADKKERVKLKEKVRNFKTTI